MNKRIVLLLVASLTLGACKKKETQAPSQTKGVTSVKVQTRTVTGYTSFPASIQGRVNNEVRAKIQGYITQVLVDEGQYVSKGQPLFRLETNTLNQSASAARAGIGAAEASVKAAQSAVNAAQVEVNKIKPLVEKNIISAVQLQTAQANLAGAQAQLSQAIAARAQASANFQGVQANIDYSVIRSPISGVVGKINLRTGSLVGPSDQQPITTVSDTSELFAYFSMNESEYLNFLKNSYGATMSEKLKNMPAVELQMANGDIYAHKGVIKAVTGQIDPNTGTIQFRVSLPNPEKILSNGNTGTILLPKTYSNVLVVPETATFEQQGLVYVYKIVKDTANSTVIQVTDRVNNLAIVEGGLKEGETVVAEGVGNLRPGTPVKAKPVQLDDILKGIKKQFNN